MYLVPEDGGGAVGAGDIDAAAITGAEVHPEAEFARDVGGGGEFVVGFAPGAIELGTDRHGGGDAVEEELGEGVAALEDFVLERECLLWSAVEVGFGPALAEEAVGIEPGVEDGVVDVGEGVEVDEAGADDCVAEIEG